MSEFPSNRDKWYVNNNPVDRAYVGDELVYPLQTAPPPEELIGTFTRGGSAFTNGEYYESGYNVIYIKATDPNLDVFLALNIGDDLELIHTGKGSRKLLNFQQRSDTANISFSFEGTTEKFQVSVGTTTDFVVHHNG